MQLFLSIKSTANYHEAHLNLAAYKSKSKAKNMQNSVGEEESIK